MRIKIYNSIYEARREVKYARQKGKNIPVRLNAYEELEGYKNNSNVYISFRSINKIGINPKSGYKTPNGIYTYPLKEVWKDFDHENKKIKVPFAGEHPYIYVIESKGKGIDDLYKYSSKDFDEDVEKLKKQYKNIDILINAATKEANVKNPGGIMWALTMFLAERKKGKQSNNWNLILHKDLGYNYIADKRSQGIIHRSEPLQAVFFSTKGFTVVDKIVQTEHRDKIYNTRNKNHWIKKAKLEDSVSEYTINRDGSVDWQGGYWLGGVWEDGIWRRGTWVNGIWKNGVKKGGYWKYGTWEDGIWENGSWGNGTWLGGTWSWGGWKKGWIYDPDRLGKEEFVLKTKGDLIFARVSPKAYFGQKKSPYN